VMEMDPEVWEQILRVNVLGTYYVTRAVLPGLLEQNSGDIVNVASTAGERGAGTCLACEVVAAQQPHFAREHRIPSESQPHM
jgi:NAD(P)-dependent dehydrogenase (short-subunit alcohol dehydrogenase family)